MSFMSIRDIQEAVLSKCIRKSNDQLLVMKPIVGYKKGFTYRDIHDVDFKDVDSVRIKKFLQEYNGSRAGALITLIIPVGATINFNLENKMDEDYSSLPNHRMDRMIKVRADIAITDSILRTRDDQYVKAASSDYVNSFVYVVPSESERKNINNLFKDQIDKNLPYVNTPIMPFDITKKICASGIHFFIDPNSAYNY